MSTADLPDPLVDLEPVDRCILVDDVLVCADLHLGLGPSAGLELPVGTGTRTVDRLETLLDRFEPAHLVVAGDILHAFDAVPFPVRDALKRLATITADRDIQTTLLAGNHDMQLEHHWEGGIQDTYQIGDTLVCHGHSQPDITADRYVIGHEHPVLEVAGRRRPCYLAGTGAADGDGVVVLPAFSRLLRGVRLDELTAEGFMSPLLTDPGELVPVVWDADAREPVTFPQLTDLQKRL
ncbi:MAG: metallophosphoesterase [Salinirussus sp.]